MTNPLQSIQAPFSKKQAARASQPPSSRRFFWKSSKHQLASLALIHVMHERPANKLANRVLLSGLGGALRNSLCEVRNEIIAVRRARFRGFANYGKSVAFARHFNGSTSFAVPNFSTANRVGKVAINGDSKSALSADIYDLDFHVFNPAPDSPRRGVNSLLIRELYHSMGDTSTGKVRKSDYFYKQAISIS